MEDRGQDFQADQVGTVLTGVGPHQIKEEPDDKLHQHQDMQGQIFQKGTHTEGGKSLSAGSGGCNNMVPISVSSEVLASTNQEPREKPVSQIDSHVTAEVLEASENLNSSPVNDKELLDKGVTSLEMLRLQFRQFCYQEASGPREVFGHLRDLCFQWLKPESHTKEQILELVILEQFLAILPPEMQSWVRGDDPGTCAQAVALAEDFLLWKEETGIQERQTPEPLEKPKAEQSPTGAKQEQRYIEEKRKCEGNDQGAENKKNTLDPEASEKSKLLSVSFDGAMPKSQEAEDGKGSYSGCKEGEKLSQQSGGNKVLNHHAFQKRMDKEKTSSAAYNYVKSFCQISGSFKYQNMQCEKKLHCYTDGQKSSAPSAQQETIQMGKEPVVGAGTHLGQKAQLSNTHKIPSGEEPHKCSECGHDFSQTLSLTGENLYICCNCGKSCSSNSVLGKQERPCVQERPPKNSERDKEPPQSCDPQTGEKPYTCTDCGKFFSFRSSLVRHQRLHTGEKPYKCLDCGKKFSQSSNLLNHQRIHTGEKPYSCTDCGKSFSNSSSLTSHERTHRGEKPYKCASCGKNFSCNSVLRIHERIHTGEKPYECLDCGKSFSRREFLIGHQRTHTGEKPYECLECGKSFSQRSNLINHQRSHTGEKPFECSDCGKKFSHKASLLKHEKNHFHGPMVQRDSARIQAALPVAEGT